MSVFKIRAYSSGSYIYPYEPIWANFGAKPVFPLVADVKGGGKPNAKNMAVKNDRLKALKETVVKKASTIVIEQSTAIQPLTFVAQGTLDAFLKASESDALDAIEVQINKLTIAEIDEVTTIMESKTLSMDSKVSK